jgi:hypothetical protein
MATRDEVYAKFGITAEAAQLLETSLGNALLPIQGLKKGWHLETQPDEAQEALDRIDAGTLGNLLGEIQKHVTFEGDLPTFFLSALKTRNRLMHGFYLRHDFKIQTDEGRDEMMVDLEAMHTELFNAWRVADAMDGILMNLMLEQLPEEKIGAMRDQLSRVVEKRLGPGKCPDLTRFVVENSIPLRRRD